jgi:hypothetical protein
MNLATPLLVALLLLQQQTFYSAHAGATGKPTATPPPINPYVYVNGACSGKRSTANCRRNGKPSPRPSARPSSRPPSPRPT